MISSERAAKIEERLTGLVGVRPEELRDYLAGNIEAGRRRRTGYRLVRGTHSGTYVRDPQGTDILPSGYQTPTS